jgi:hypothetical protein
MNLGKGKNFKLKSKYYEYLILRFLILFVFSWLFVETIMYSEVELFEMFANRKLIGIAKQRGAILLERFIVRNWGKQGMVIAAGLILSGALYFFLKEIFEFRRFLKKEKLFKQGLVDNMYDDHKPRRIFQIIKWVFSKKERNNRQKYKFEDINKLQKDLEKDGLYQKLYGKKDKK